MAETASKLPVKSEPARTHAVRAPFFNLRREIDRLFDDFDGRFWSSNSLFDQFPFNVPMATMPAVDIAERDDAFEITADMPGMDEKDVEVRTVNGGLVIKGQKKAEKEEKSKNYYLSERNYGAFERTFGLPAGVDADKISASFKNGVLTVTLPKTAEARKSEKTIPVKTA